MSPRLASLHLQGHGAELALFREALGKGRMPHAWLVTGPPGIGKATFAFALARILLGGEAEELPAGRRISAATHADLLVVERGYDEKNSVIGRKSLPMTSGRLTHFYAGPQPREAGGWFL